MMTGFDGVDKDQRTFLEIWASLTGARDAIDTFVLNRMDAACQS